MKTELIRLIKNLIVVALISIAGYFAYQHFFSEKNTELSIAETPIQIENIKSIAEISAVSYKDEIVVDSIEFFDKDVDYSYFNPIDLYKMYNRNIKRRLTLIVHGEVKYGIDLSDNNYSVFQNKDTLWLHLPRPEITDVIISPSKTEIFTEKGNWTDNEKKEMLIKATKKLKKNAKKLNLHKKALKNTRTIFQRMIVSRKKLLIYFDYEK